MIFRKNNRSPLTRFKDNPILEPDDMPFDCYTVMNVGVTRFKGDVLLLLRVEDRRRDTHFHVARSKDGINFSVNPVPIIYPESQIDQMGANSNRFDMRITRIGDIYYVFHAVWTDPWGSMINLAKTTDFVHFEQISNSVPSNRNAVLFPDKINGNFARLERPQNIDGSGRIWYSESPDLEFWGKSMPVCLPRLNWSQRKSGPSCIPIRTEKGYLAIYHATSRTASSENYYLGVCLLDLEQPWKVIAAPKEFILAPEMPYECMGQTPNVVFTGGGCEMDNGKYYIYYGGADTRLCLAITTIEELLDYCLDSNVVETEATRGVNLAYY